MGKPIIKKYSLLIMMLVACYFMLPEYKNESEKGADSEGEAESNKMENKTNEEDNITFLILVQHCTIVARNRIINLIKLVIDIRVRIYPSLARLYMKMPR